MKRIFVSYERRNGALAAAVLRLAEQLRDRGGLELLLDLWHPGPPAARDAWAAEALGSAEEILIVWSPGWPGELEGPEGLALRQRLGRRCAVAVLEGEAAPPLPDALGMAAWFPAGTDAGLDALHERLLARPRQAPSAAPAAPAVPESAAPAPEMAAAAPEDAAGSAPPAGMGRVLYSIPPRMQAGTRYEAAVRIAPEPEAAALFDGLGEDLRRHAQEGQLKLSQLMAVELMERDSDRLFDIQALSTPEQPVGIAGWGPTQWDFHLTPLRPGRSLLVLRVMAVLQLPGFGERRRDVLVFERDIEVLSLLAEHPRAEETEIPLPAVEPLIAAGELRAAMELLAARIPEAMRDELLLLQGRLSALEQDMLRGILSPEQITLERNRLLDALLKLRDAAGA
ncbi:MAG: SEFIR domain-containing protein [Bacteroidia bacterium]|nr:SEFIR domain-containing protein [Bacteroidia bacterium]